MRGNCAQNVIRCYPEQTPGTRLAANKNYINDAEIKCRRTRVRTTPERQSHPHRLWGREGSVCLLWKGTGALSLSFRDRKSLLTSIGVTNSWRYTSLSLYFIMACFLINRRDFTYTFYHAKGQCNSYLVQDEKL